jgi:leucyl/phenylalanyl-tRNA--protein transferase
MPLRLTAELMLNAYAAGIFPMAESASSTELYWFDPPLRAILPLDHGFHLPRSAAKQLRRLPLTITRNRDFTGVIAGCADRPETWINQTIVDIFTKLHQQGHAHSVEAWQEDEMVGGLYGAAIGGAFFAESMFSRVSGASTQCLVHLVGHLRTQGFTLCDVQFKNEHIARFGVQEIARAAYQARLREAMQLSVVF